MELTDKIANLKALVEKLDSPDEALKELLTGVVDALEALEVEVGTMRDNLDDISDNLDDISDELEELEDELADLDDLLECDCGCEDEDEEDSDEDEDGDDEDEEYFYEVSCPSCDNVFTLSEADLDNGFLICPHCQEKLTIDDDSDCDCGCDHDHHHE